MHALYHISPSQSFPCFDTSFNRRANKKRESSTDAFSGSFKKTQIGDVHAHTCIIIRPTNQIICKCLLPTTTATGLTTNPTKIAAIVLIIICLHERRPTPRITIEVLDPVRHRLLGDGHLPAAHAIPNVAYLAEGLLGLLSSIAFM